MSNWNHRGIEITLTGTGKFRATIEGKPVVLTSLDAIKKKIDKATDDPNKFQPFKAIRLWGVDEAQEIEVIGQRQAKRRRFGDRLTWVCQTPSVAGTGLRSGEFENDLVVRATPETEAIFVELQALKKKHEAEKRAMEEAERALWERLGEKEERPK